MCLSCSVIIIIRSGSHAWPEQEQETRVASSVTFQLNGHKYLDLDWISQNVQMLSLDPALEYKYQKGQACNQVVLICNHLVTDYTPMVIQTEYNYIFFTFLNQVTL